MWTKKRLVVAFASTTVGVMFLIRGGLFVATAYAASSVDQGNSVGVSLSQGKVFATAKTVSNIVPGDSSQGLLQIKNTGSQTETILIQNTITGDIFRDNGKTGTSLGTAVNPSDGNHRDGISVDYAAKNYNKAYEFDNYPLEIRYNVSVSGEGGNALPIEVRWFSANNTSPAIQLPPGQIATVTYKYYMPWQAHNDYQGATGTINISVTALGESSPSGNGSSSSSKPSPSPEGVTGATIPVTGLPFLSILLEGAALIGLGFISLWASRKKQ